MHSPFSNYILAYFHKYWEMTLRSVWKTILCIYFTICYKKWNKCMKSTSWVLLIALSKMWDDLQKILNIFYIKMVVNTVKILAIITSDWFLKHYTPMKINNERNNYTRIERNHQSTIVIRVVIIKNLLHFVAFSFFQHILSNIYILFQSI